LSLKGILVQRTAKKIAHLLLEHLTASSNALFLRPPDPLQKKPVHNSADQLGKKIWWKPPDAEQALAPL
jgi:hypothetical protein